MIFTDSLTPALASTEGFAPQSRVWVYVTNRRLTDQEAQTMQVALDRFTSDWTAHNQALQAKAEVFQNHAILLMVDETRAGASGCSIDKSVRFLEQLGDQIGVDCFDRMRLAWIKNDTATTEMSFEPRHTFEGMYRNGEINDSSYVVNTLVQTKAELTEKWLMPLGDSWHRRLV